MLVCNGLSFDQIDAFSSKSTIVLFSDALTLDFGSEKFTPVGYGSTIRSTSASADTILEAHDHQLSCYTDSTCQQLTKSCPLLAAKLVSSATQTEEGPTQTMQKQRAPAIASTKYAIVNTSTGSSTSGAVDLDISSCSNKSEPGSVYRGKGVLIVETACAFDDDDPMGRHRSTSFKRAIERGFSGESNLSYETVDPATSPDTPDLPPYPEPPSFRHTTSTRHDVPDLLHPYCTDNSLTSTQATAQYMCSTTR